MPASGPGKVYDVEKFAAKITGTVKLPSTYTNAFAIKANQTAGYLNKNCQPVDGALDAAAAKVETVEPRARRRVAVSDRTTPERAARSRCAGPESIRLPPSFSGLSAAPFALGRTTMYWHTKSP